MYSATGYNSSTCDEDFVMTPIKCPPPKIVAVKRSLKKKKKAVSVNIMDDDDSDVKEDIISIDSNDENDSKDLIEFEREEPLIDLSDNSNDEHIQDTVKDMNAKNSNSSTITMLLDLLEIGSIITTSSANETAIVGSCAESDDYDTLPTIVRQKKIKSSSSSLNEIPLESPSACAHVDTGKTELSSIPSLPQPLSAIQPENPSIVKKYSFCTEKSQEIDINSRQKSCESDIKLVGKVYKGIDEDFIDFEKLQKNLTQNPEESIFTSILRKSSCINESSKISCCALNNDCSSKSDKCIASDKCLKSSSSSEDNDQKIFNTDYIVQEEDKEKEELLQQQQQLHVSANSKNNNQNNNINSIIEAQLIKSQVEQRHHKEIISSDKNNNSESVCNQNFSTSHDGSNVKVVDQFDFLSANTSQRKLPPKFYSSTTSLHHQDSCFEASTRLKRLEERFKGFSYTKKLLRSSKVFSKSEEILSSVGKDREFKSLYCGSNTTDSLNSSSLLQFPLTTSSTLSENSLQYECDNRELLNYDTTSKILTHNGEYQIEEVKGSRNHCHTQGMGKRKKIRKMFMFAFSIIIISPHHASIIIEENIPVNECVHGRKEFESLGRN